MGRNETPLRHAILTFAAAASLTFAAELFLTICGLFKLLVILCPWAIYFGSDPLILVADACLIGIFAGVLAYLRRTLADMETHCNHAINELRTRLQTLEEKLDTKEKD